MIEILLTTPLIASLVLFFIRSKRLSKVMINAYGLMHLLLTINIVFLNNKLLSLTYFDYTAKYFQVDSLAKIFLLVLSLLFMGTVVYNNWFMKVKNLNKKLQSNYIISLLLFSVSMTGVVLSNNLLLSWILIEATTLATAFTIYSAKTKNALLATWKYLFLCSFGISIALIGINILLISIPNDIEGASLFFNNLYELAPKMSPILLQVSFAFILVGIGAKVGLFPLHVWLPDAHSEAPVPVSALLSGTLLNTAFLILLRVYKIIELANLTHYIQMLMFVIGFMSLLIATINIIEVKNYKRLLAYSSIENMAIILLGVAIGGVGTFGAMLHLVTHSLLKAAFFLTAGNIAYLYQTQDINKVNNLARIDKTSGTLWLLAFIGIIGLPPSPLFLSELKIISAFWMQGHVFLAIIFVTLLTIILFGFADRVLKMCFGSLILKIDLKKNEFSLNKYITQITFLLIILILGVYMPKFIHLLLINASAVL